MGDLARKTKILIATVGPYSLYGEKAFKAAPEMGLTILTVRARYPGYTR
jgi:short subunit dehydrogenase-like uncharacterized protein